MSDTDCISVRARALYDLDQRHSRLYSPVSGDEGPLKTLNQINMETRHQPQGSGVSPPTITINDDQVNIRTKKILREIEQMPKDELNSIFRTKIINPPNGKKIKEIRGMDVKAATKFIGNENMDGKYLVELWRHKKSEGKIQRTNPNNIEGEIFNNKMTNFGLENIMDVLITGI